LFYFIFNYFGNVYNTNYSKSVGSVSYLLGLFWRWKPKHAARRTSVIKERIGCASHVRFAAVNHNYLLIHSNGAESVLRS